MTIFRTSKVWTGCLYNVAIEEIDSFRLRFSSREIALDSFPDRMTGKIQSENAFIPFRLWPLRSILATFRLSRSDFSQMSYDESHSFSTYFRRRPNPHIRSICYSFSAWLTLPCMGHDGVYTQCINPPRKLRSHKPMKGWTAWLLYRVRLTDSSTEFPFSSSSPILSITVLSILGEWFNGWLVVHRHVVRNWLSHATVLSSPAFMPDITWRLKPRQHGRTWSEFIYSDQCSLLYFDMLCRSSTTSGDPGGERRRGLAGSTVSSGPVQNQFGGQSSAVLWRRCGKPTVHNEVHLSAGGLNHILPLGESSRKCSLCS
jgi:hypothetical protein